MNRPIAIVLFCLLAFSVQARGQASAPPLRLVQTIPLPNVKGRIVHFNVDVGGKRLFIAALGNHTVEVVDLKDGKWMRSVSGVKKPQGVWYIDTLGKLFVADGDAGDVKVYRGGDLRLIATIPLDLGPDAEAYDPVTKRLYVGYGGEDAGKSYGEVAVIDAATDKHIGDIRTDAHPGAILVADSGRTIYITVPKSQEIAVIDAQTLHVVSKWRTLAQDPVSLAIDSTHHRLFVGARKPPALEIYDSASHKRIDSLPSVGLMDGLFHDSARHRIYASGGEGYVAVYQQMDANHYKQIAKIPTGPIARTSLFVPAFTRYYVAVPADDNHGAEIRAYEPER
ncbi:MAG: YncE family protein [Acidobacteriota bacterium]|nr:YncE family protein [Acidobacteriota bacterium]